MAIFAKDLWSGFQLMQMKFSIKNFSFIHKNSLSFERHVFVVQILS